MRLRAVVVLLAICLLAITAGCVPLSPLIADSGPRVDSEAWCAEIAWGREAWRQEASKRLEDPYIFVCHGGSWRDAAGDHWELGPDAPRPGRSVESKAWDLHLAMPDRDIVLIVCNRAGVPLNVPRVWYARSKVWCIPNSLLADHDCATNIWQFESGDP